MNAEIVIPVVLAIAVAFVLIPAIVIAATGIRRRAICPETGGFVQLRLDRGEEVKRMFNDGRPFICDCSRWPENADCNQQCRGSLS